MQFGIIEYAHLSGKFGDYAYEITTTSSNMSYPPKSGEEPGVPLDKSKTLDVPLDKSKLSDVVMIHAHDVLYFGVLKK